MEQIWKKDKKIKQNLRFEIRLKKKVFYLYILTSSKAFLESEIASLLSWVVDNNKGFVKHEIVEVKNIGGEKWKFVSHLGTTVRVPNLKKTISEIEEEKNVEIWEIDYSI